MVHHDRGDRAHAATPALARTRWRYALVADGAAPCLATLLPRILVTWRTFITSGGQR
jgi:hypothetical protein